MSLLLVPLHLACVLLDKLTYQSSAVPLLFSLLAPLSGTLPVQPSLHTPYLRIMLDLFLNPVSSLRGASPRTAAASSSKGGGAPSAWNIVPAHQVQEHEGVLPADVVELVVDDFWAKYDDLRWALFRETRYVNVVQTCGRCRAASRRAY